MVKWEIFIAMIENNKNNNHIIMKIKIKVIMSYYLFNRQEILEKTKKRYSKEKAAEYYLQNKEVIEEKARNRYENLSEEEKNKIKEYQKKRYQELIQYKKEALKNK